MFSFDTKKNNKNTVSSIITSLFFVCIVYYIFLAWTKKKPIVHLFCDKDHKEK